MARCRCTTEQCVCALVGGTGISVDGSGSPSSPWVVTATGLISGEGIPAGGTTGQILAKDTGADFDTEWIDPPEGGGGPGSVPAGGTTGQLLAKNSAVDYDTEWVAAPSGGTTVTTEEIVDAVAAALVAGSNIDVTYNDAGGTITIAVEALTTADVAGLTPIVVKATEPVAADYGLGTIPLNAIWVQSAS